MFQTGSADQKSPILINDSIDDAVEFIIESSSPLLPEMYSPGTSPTGTQLPALDQVSNFEAEVKGGFDEDATQDEPLSQVMKVSKEWYQVTETICRMLSEIPESQLKGITGINGEQLAELLNRRRSLPDVTAHSLPRTDSKPQINFEESMDSMAFLLDSEGRFEDFEEQPNHLSPLVRTSIFSPIQTSTQAPAYFRQLPTPRATLKAPSDIPTATIIHNFNGRTVYSSGSEASSPNLQQTQLPKVFKPFQPPVRDATAYNPPFVTSTSRGGNTAVPVTCDSPQTVPAEDDELEFRGQYQHSQVMKMEFERTFGLKSFRLKQEEAINAVMLGHDAFILMPTGGGKSLCYQIPAILSGGVTVVISPLRSLILDQVQRLNVLQVPAAHLSGDQTAVEEQAVYFQLSKQDPIYKLIYLTPEKLSASFKLKSALNSLSSRGLLDRVVIDEAHCISQWGHDFRPDYKRLSELKNNFRGIQILALTATATNRVRFDVARLLKLNNTKWFVGSCNRTNLKYDIRKKKTSSVNGEISELIQSEYRGASGIVYCLSRKDCGVVSQALLEAGISAAAYHAGMSDSDRTNVQKKWLSQRYNVICATIAFGMGIDKPDVRFVIHHSMPKSLEGYYQESGRAGRDGQVASCILFYSYVDAVRMKSIILKDSKTTNNNPSIHIENIHMMVQFCENITDCRRVQILNYLGEEFSSEECGNTCDNCRNMSQSEVVEKDMTQEAQSVILSITMLSHVNMTLVQLSEIFRGCQTQKILQSNYNTLPMYGKSNGLNRTDIDRFLHLLIVRGVLMEEAQIGQHDNVYNYIRIGAEAEKVLKESTRIVFHCSPPNSVTSKFKQRNSANGGDSDSEHTEQSAIHPNFQECLDQLRLLRQQVSEEEDISPENIFNMATLREMSYSLPDSFTTFLAVTGVTQAKWKKFRGKAFLEITSKYCKLKREFLSKQADTLKVRSSTQSLPTRRQPGPFMKKKSKYFKKGSSQNKKFTKNFNGKSSKAVASSLTLAGVKTVNYTCGSSTRILAPPVPKGKKIS